MGMQVLAECKNTCTHRRLIGDGIFVPTRPVARASSGFHAHTNSWGAHAVCQRQRQKQTATVLRRRCLQGKAVCHALPVSSRGSQEAGG